MLVNKQVWHYTHMAQARSEWSGSGKGLSKKSGELERGAEGEEENEVVKAP